MEASLQQLGKSRADLWQFAGLVALERSLERANRACDLDKWARQQVGRWGLNITPQQCDFWNRPFSIINSPHQVTLLEGRAACEIKLRAPLRFWSGRADCVSEDEGGRGFKAAKEEVQPRLLGDARHATDFFLEHFNMDPEHSQVLNFEGGSSIRSYLNYC